MASGFQDFWVTGTRALFQRETDSAGNQYPWIDLGIIDVASPDIAVEQIQLEDSDGGLKRVADFRVTKIDETYSIQCANLNLDNLALLFMSNAPVSFTQAQTEKNPVTHRVFPGRLVKIIDSDTAKTPLYALDAFAGMYTGTVTEDKVLESITASTKTLKLTGDQTAVGGLAPGKVIIVKKAGLTKIANSSSYTIVTRTLNAGKTDLVVEETPAGDESGITGSIIHENAGVIYKVGIDWEVASLVRGFVRILSGGALSTEQDVKFVFTIGALSGKRQVNPQDLKGQVKGQMILFWGRNNNAEQTAREFTVVMAPAGAAFAVDDYSKMTLTCKVLTDLTKTIPAGRLLQILGNLPTVS